MDDDGRPPETRVRMARGTAPSALTSRTTVDGSGPVALRAAPEEPAGSIAEAVERLVAAKEADEALAEWLQGGG
ncbi:MAG TPA: hypothetical protein VGD37_15760 [Kofleriaceae bacterium]|jgi:hypothetical protein